MKSNIGESAISKKARESMKFTDSAKSVNLAKLARFYRFSSNRSLKSIIIFLLLTITMIPFLVNSIVTVSVSKNSTMQEERQKLSSQAVGSENTLLTKFSAYEALLKLLSTSPNINNYKAFKGYNLLIKLQLQEIIATHAELSSLFVVSEDNEHFYYREPTTPPGDDTKSDWYQAVRQTPKKVLWDPAVTLDKLTNNWVKTFRMGFKNTSTNEFAGVVSVSLKMDDFSAELQKLSQYDQMTRLVISGDNDVVASSDPSWIGLKFPFAKNDFATDAGLIDITYQNDRYYGSLEEIPTFGLKVAVLQSKEMTLSHLNQILMWNWIMIGVIGIVYIVAAIVLSYIITRPITEINRSLESISNKDFTVNELNAGASWAKEFRLLKMSFNNMYKSYKEAVHSIIDSSGKLIDHSAKMKEQAETSVQSMKEANIGIVEICNGSMENALAAEKGLDKAHHLSDSIKESLGTFETIMNIAAQATKSNQDTISASEELIAHSRFSHSCNQEIMDSVSALISSLDQINAILGNMNNISSETNILSLNASIEAARAGEYGKGFAIVAAEIRKLSQKSDLATDQISDLLGGIQEHSKKITGIMENTRTASDKQLRLVENNREVILKNLEVFDEVVTKIEIVKDHNDAMALSIAEMSDMMQTTAAVSQETSALTEQLNATMDTEVRTAEELLNTSLQLNKLTDNLNQTSGSFKMNK